MRVRVGDQSPPGAGFRALSLWDRWLCFNHQFMKTGEVGTNFSKNLTEYFLTVFGQMTTDFDDFLTTIICSGYCFPEGSKKKAKSVV